MPVDSVRSRSGCTTCRRRKKKCDELWEEGAHPGICRRCHQGSFECIMAPAKRAGPKPRAPKTTSAPISLQLPHPPSSPSSPSSAGSDNLPSLLGSVSASPIIPSALLNPPPPMTGGPSSMSVHPHSRALPLPPHDAPRHTPAAPTPSLNILDLNHELDLLQPQGHSEQLISFFESLDSMPHPDVQPDPTPAAWDSFKFEHEVPRPLQPWDHGAAGAPPPARPHHCEKPEHAAGNCDCTGPSLLYAALNEEFYRSLPNPVREIVKMRTGDVAASHDLTRAASMAMILLHRARSQPVGGAEAEALLIKQSDNYFQQAVMHLETAAIPLEAQLVAVADMQLHQFDQAGAAGTYAILLVGEFFVREALGTTPLLDVATIADASSISLWAFAYADVLRTVCLPRQRCLFDFVGLPGSPEAAKELANQNFTHIGLPVGLMLCFAAASNLGVEATSLVPDVLRAKATAIEDAIRNWRPAAPDLTVALDSASYVDTITTQEMWRHAARIYLYQAVYRVGCLSSVIRNALRQILRLGARQISVADDVSGSVYAGSVRGCPWFLAASVAVLPEDRELCRKGLEGCGTQRVHRDNLEAAERIWEVTDTAGWAVDWKDLMEKEGRFVAFL